MCKITLSKTELAALDLLIAEMSGSHEEAGAPIDVKFTPAVARRRDGGEGHRAGHPVRRPGHPVRGRCRRCPGQLRGQDPGLRALRGGALARSADPAPQGSQPGQ